MVVAATHAILLAMSSDLPLAVFNRALMLLRRARLVSAPTRADHLMRRTAEDLCDRLEITQREFGLALEIGAGTGCFAAECAKRGLLGRKIGHLAGVDVVPAASVSAVIDGEVMPLGDARLDLIVANLTLHWANDLPGVLIQCRRALRPDGLFLASFFGGRTLQELRGALLDAELEARGGAAARVSPFADTQDAARVLQRAGFALPVADSDIVRVRYDTPFGLFRDLKAMGETAALAGPRAPPLTRTILARAADLYVERHSDPDGRVGATFEIVTVTGWAPHDSQQKPLRPGSARMRLAEALGSTERSAGEKAGS